MACKVLHWREGGSGRALCHGYSRSFCHRFAETTVAVTCKSCLRHLAEGAGQMSFFETPVYPDAPAFRPVDTSRKAAEAVASKAAVLRERVLVAIRAKPSTTHQIAKALGERYESVQPRTSELVAKGLIYDSGERGPSRDPTKRAIVWTAAAQRAEAA